MVAEKKNASKPHALTITATANDPFIMSASFDRTYFIFTPIIVVAIFVIGLACGMGEQAAFIAATVGAAGHHLPGMMRAYADRELFSQFRLRFILAPIALVLICSMAMYFKFAAVNAVMLIWGFWHGMAQLYGFARIYDRKTSGTSPNQGRLDLTLLGLWFGNGVVNSDNRMVEILSLLVDCGLQSIQTSHLELFSQLWLVASISFSTYYLYHAMAGVKRGQRPSLNKLLLLSISLAYWNLVMIMVPVTILSIALFELCHDAQYLGIVWSFNKNRTNKGLLSAGFEKAMYSSGAIGVGLYIVAVIAYGSVAMTQYWHPVAEARNVAIIFFTVSTLLHFYYDGFIWKLRNKSISSSLKLTNPDQTIKQDVSGNWGHGLKWLFLLLITGGLAFGQANDNRDLIAKKSMIFAAVPASPKAKNDLIEVLKDSAKSAAQFNKRDEAIILYKKALELSPSDREVQGELLKMSTDSINFLE